MIMEPNNQDFRSKMTPDGVLLASSLCIAMDTYNDLEGNVNKDTIRVFGGGVYISPAFKAYVWQIDAHNNFSLVTTDKPAQPASSSLTEQVKTKALIAIKNALFDVSIFDLTRNMC